MAKKAATGSRVTVVFGPVKGGKKGKAKSKAIAVPEQTAKTLGLKSGIATIKDKKGATRRVRGEKGGKSIKIPIGNKIKGKQKYRQIPVPSGATLLEINGFLKKTMPKVKFFISPDGRKYAVV